MISIATYNTEGSLEYTLQSIRERLVDQNELEILVVDVGSTDKTKELLINLELSYKVIRNVNQV